MTGEQERRVALVLAMTALALSLFMIGALAAGLWRSGC